MSNDKAFIWAQGQNAQVAEPDQDLLASGWSKGDIPAASNFNWLFKTMTEDLHAFKKDLHHMREEFAHLRTAAIARVENVKAEVGTFKDRTAQDFESIKQLTTAELSKAKSETNREISKLNDGVVLLKGESSALKDATKALQDKLEKQRVELSDVTESGRETKKSHDLLCTSLSKKLMWALENILKMETGILSVNPDYRRLRWPNFGILPQRIEESDDE